MEFEWDETKRAANRVKHVLDFKDAPSVWSGPTRHAPAKSAAGEARWQVTGKLGDVYVTVIYTLRTGTIRIISMRRARDEEKRDFCKIHGG